MYNDNVEKLYKLEPFGQLKIDNKIWTRIPGGWLISDVWCGHITNTFIPFSNEFQKSGLVPGKMYTEKRKS